MVFDLIGSFLREITPDWADWVWGLGTTIPELVHSGVAQIENMCQDVVFGIITRIIDFTTNLHEFIIDFLV